MTHEETIQRIEDRYPMGSLEFQIKYCRAIMQAQMDDLAASPDQQGKRARPRLPLTQVNRCHEMLSMHERAHDMRQKLIQADINEELGQDSPHYRANNTRPDYDEYIRLRLLVKQAPTRRSEGRSPGRPAVSPSNGNGGPARRSLGEGGGRGYATSSSNQRYRAQGSGPQGSGSFLDGSMSKKVPDPFRAGTSDDHSTGSWQDNPHGLPELPPGKSALDSIFESAFEEAMARSAGSGQARMNQEPRTAATPEINALFDDWSEKVARWMDKRDYTIPPPRMDDRLWKALEHDAQYDPNVNQWFHTVKQLNLMHEQAKNMAEFTDFAQAIAAQPSAESGSGQTNKKAPPGRAGSRGEVAATSSSAPEYRSQGATTENNKPEKLAKIIPGPGNPNFNTRA